MQWPVWNVYVIVPVVCNHLVLPQVTFFFFCRYCGSSFTWAKGVGYVLLAAGLVVAEWMVHLPGSVGFLLEIALLAWYGRSVFKRTWTEMWMISVLVTAVLGMSNGITRWIDRRAFLPVIMHHIDLVLLSDGVREFGNVLLVLCFYVVVLRRFRRTVINTNRQALFQLTVPVLFMGLAERILQESFYGDTMEMDSSGVITSVISVNHGEILFLQIFACVSLLAVLFSYDRITGVLRAEQDNRLLRQRAAEQAVYVEEARLRYGRTRSFRHDIRNHLTVLKELLKLGEGDKAYEYLARLEEMSEELSYPVHTGNTVVDALMGSKLAAAEQKGIEIQCEITIPGDSEVEDMDWCIVLSNALDNAIKACDDVEKEKRYMRIEGKKKGNLYLVTVENSCDGGLWKVPEDGTGLANIRAVMEKYGGTVRNQVSGGVYRLGLLFAGKQQ